MFNDWQLKFLFFSKAKELKQTFYLSCEKLLIEKNGNSLDFYDVANLIEKAAKTAEVKERPKLHGNRPKALKIEIKDEKTKLKLKIKLI